LGGTQLSGNSHCAHPSTQRRGPSRWLALGFVPLLSACALVRDWTDPTTISVRGLPPTLEQLNVGAAIDAQNQLVAILITTAGLPGQPPPDDPRWAVVAKAGIYEIGRQYDQYLDVLFRFNRVQRAGRQDLAAAAAAAGAIMGLTGVSSKAIGITAAAFGLASGLFEAHVNSVLFTIEPSALRNVALQGLKRYFEQLDLSKITSRPDTLIALQGYLTQCSPAALEANINNAASGAPSVVSPVPGEAEKAAALAAPSSTALAPPPPPIERPTYNRPPEDPNDPYATLTNEDFNHLRVLFGLGRFEATSANSPRFLDKVKSFQKCLNSRNQAGFLTRSQLTIALKGDPMCMPTPAPAAPASPPARPSASRPTAPSSPQPLPGASQQPPPPPITTAPSAPQPLPGAGQQPPPPPISR
jgi:hypothetical protein